MGVKRRRAVDGVDKGDDAVEAKPQHEIGMIHDRVQHRGGIGEAGRLDDDACERRDAAIIAAAQDIFEGRDEIAANRAAGQPDVMTSMPSPDCSTRR